MILVLLGPPGSGKGTQAKYLQEYFGLLHLSTGDLLRRAVADKTELGLEIQQLLAQGNLVRDDLVGQLLEHNMQQLQAEKLGCILDGFPRTLSQGEMLDVLLSRNNMFLTKVVLLDVKMEVVFSRLVGRRTCPQCGAMYHEQTAPSSKGDLCAICLTHLVVRPDDREDVIKKRLSIYHEQTAPLIDFYHAKSNMLTVLNANNASEDVFVDLKNILAYKIRQLC